MRLQVSCILVTIVTCGLWGSIPWHVDFMHLVSPEWGMSAGKISPLVVSNGYFYNDAGRVRFWGVNITGDKNFPLKVDAPRIARSLRLMGINIVRLHFMEYSWGGSLLISPESEELDPSALDRLDYFVFCLKNEGIYININLHVGRVFPQVPPQDRNVFELGKVVSYLDEKTLESQKRYASALLGHTNPYTGMPYCLDPVVAMIEVNNENTLAGVEMDSLLRLSGYYHQILRQWWTEFLKKRYTNYHYWKEANKIEEKEGFCVIQTNRRQRFFWRWEAHEGAKSSLEWKEDVFQWRVERAGKEEWHNQFMCAGIPLVRGRWYEVTFEARSQDQMPLRIFLMQNYAPWSGLGYYTNVYLSSSWREYKMRFLAGQRETNARLNFTTVGEKTGMLEMRNFVMREVVFQQLTETHWLKGGIPLPWEGLAGEHVLQDFRRMLLERERYVASEMRRHIRGMGCQKPITHTQITYGGLAGFVREAELSDFVDVHAYWQHPEFPGDAWSPTNWTIRNASQLTDEGLGPLSYVAYWRVRGKPFTVSEYNVPNPNFYGAEAPVWLALWGAFQDWDGTYLYSLLDFGGNYYQTFMAGFFHLIGSGGQMSLLPWAARVFREGMVWDQEEVRPLSLQEAQDLFVHHGPSYDIKRVGGWGNESLFARVSMDTTGRRLSRSLQRMPWIWEKKRPFLLWQGEKAFLLTGEIKGVHVTNQKMVIEVMTHSPWGTVALCSLDGHTWQKTSRMLGVFVGQGENKGMKWNATQTSVGKNWGRAPYLLKQPKLRIYLPGWRAYVLNQRGEKGAEVVSERGWFVFSELLSPWVLFERDKRDLSVTRFF